MLSLDVQDWKSTSEEYATHNYKIGMNMLKQD